MADKSELSDFQALLITIETTNLRLAANYRDAEVMRRRINNSAAMAANSATSDYAAVWLLIGTWERIAMFVQDFNEKQRHRFFRCHPVKLVWDALDGAVTAIRVTSGPMYANTFATLAGEYDTWSKSEDGKDFRTPAHQTVCALFA